MPLYELFCLTRPAAANKQALAQVIKTAGETVLAKGGVLTDLTFFGEQQLAYEIRKPSGKFAMVMPSLQAVAPASASVFGAALTLSTPRFPLCVDQPLASTFRNSCAAVVRISANCLILRRANNLQADIWQLQFKVGPAALKDVEHNLKVDERVLR